MPRQRGNATELKWFRIPLEVVIKPDVTVTSDTKEIDCLTVSLASRSPRLDGHSVASSRWLGLVTMNQNSLDVSVE